MFEQVEGTDRRTGRGPCARIVAAVFGSVFLVVLLSVPVTTTTSRVRQEEGSHIVVRTTYPVNASMSLFRVLSLRSRPKAGTAVRVRSTQWIATMAVVLALGLFDYAVLCRLLRLGRQRRSDDATID
ncbi:MAG: hypothetical protein MUE80_08880 [Acidobacteria bacterium]|jgi:hypothetical protein|nr:hypothetical protein [Acidobacteriota bacterium]